jgi:uncharacterized zinc-type alcohol dehydrogenase-like protein
MYVLAGIPPAPLRVDPMSLTYGEKRIAGTGSGGRPGTQEMLDFCAEHAITADIELVRPEQVNEALQRLDRGDVRFRFVIDLAG